MLLLQDIDGMTRDYGEEWGYPHVRRVLKLIDLIGTETPHDAEVLTWSSYMHDWGAFPRYRLSDVPHALRSRQIAESDILAQTHFTVAQKSVLLEVIEKHDYQDQRPVESNEALLLREADWLDMLGGIGVVREFAWGPNDLQRCYDRVLKHRDLIQQRFTLPLAKQIATERIESMNLILSQITTESFEIL